MGEASHLWWSRTQSLLGLGMTNSQVPVLSSAHGSEKEMQPPPRELLFWAAHIPETFQMDQDLQNCLETKTKRKKNYKNNTSPKKTPNKTHKPSN